MFGLTFRYTELQCATKFCKSYSRTSTKLWCHCDFVKFSYSKHVHRCFWNLNMEQKIMTKQVLFFLHVITLLKNSATNLFVNEISQKSSLCKIICISWKQWVGRPNLINIANNNTRLKNRFVIVQEHRHFLVNRV